jgi:hypothetical protein
MKEGMMWELWLLLSEKEVQLRVLAKEEMMVRL